MAQRVNQGCMGMRTRAKTFVAKVETVIVLIDWTKRESAGDNYTCREVAIDSFSKVGNSPETYTKRTKS